MYLELNRLEKRLLERLVQRRIGQLENQRIPAKGTLPEAEGEGQPLNPEVRLLRGLLQRLEEAAYDVLC